MLNNAKMTPIQLAAYECNLNCLEVFLKQKDTEHHLILTQKNETLLHLACKGALSRLLGVKDDMSNILESDFDEFDSNKNRQADYWNTLEQERRRREDEILKVTYPCLDFLLEIFKKNPDYLEIEDDLETSPGLILHYFTILNHVRGVKSLLKDPFLIRPNSLNKNKLPPLWIASWYNMTRLGKILLEFGADPNVSDLQVGYTPLHNAILGYHISRVDETCAFLDDLLDHGADPKAMDYSGETAAHLSIGTLDFRVMSKFLAHFGSSIQDVKDDSGNTLFHYAVGCLDEDSIYHMMSNGANLMSCNCKEVQMDEDEEFRPRTAGKLIFNFGSDRNFYTRSRSVVIERIPLQEAMKNGNATAYFNALRRIDFKDILASMDNVKSYRFLCMHLTAATRDVRPDIVRILFHHINDERQLHDILLFKGNSRGFHVSLDEFPSSLKLF